MDAWIYEMIDKQVAYWFTAQCKNLGTEYHIYFRPAKGKTRGDIVIADTQPTPEHLKMGMLSIDWPVAGARNRLIDACQRLPLIPQK